jgi:hypothetical protein
MRKALFFFIALALFQASGVLAAGKPQVYSSWDTMEMDKVASLWLIKKFVDPAATFRFYPQGAMEMEGVQVDTPTSQFRRTQLATAYESLLKAHGLNDPALLQIGQIVRDVELNIWGQKKLQETQGIDLVLKGIFLIGANPQDSMEKGFMVMEALYKALSTSK